MNNATNQAILHQTIVTRCSLCSISMYKKGDLKKHKRTDEHINLSKSRGTYCHTCRKSFVLPTALETHIKKLHSPISCEICATQFLNKHKLKIHIKTSEHMQSSKGAGVYCPDCEIFPPSVASLEQHMTLKHDVNRPATFHCCDCSKDFTTNTAFKTHMYFHRFGKDEPRCSLCPMEFKSEKAYARHMQRGKHKNLSCPVGLICSRRFASVSALVMHLESGACKSGMDRKQLNQLVLTYDTTNAIMLRIQYQGEGNVGSSYTIPNRSYHTNASDSGSDGGVIFTPTSEDGEMWQIPSFGLSHELILVSDWDDRNTLSSNMQARCDICDKEFSSKQRLEAHMNSAIHDPLIFHCPILLLELEGGKQRYFRRLSSLIQHMEVGACNGGVETFQKAIEIVQQLATRLGFTLPNLIN